MDSSFQIPMHSSIYNIVHEINLLDCERKEKFLECLNEVYESEPSFLKLRQIIQEACNDQKSLFKIFLDCAQTTALADPALSIFRSAVFENGDIYRALPKNIFGKDDLVGNKQRIKEYIVDALKPQGRKKRGRDTDTHYSQGKKIKTDPEMPVAFKTTSVVTQTLAKADDPTEGQDVCEIFKKIFEFCMNGVLPYSTVCKTWNKLILRYISVVRSAPLSRPVPCNEICQFSLSTSLPCGNLVKKYSFHILQSQMAQPLDLNDDDQALISSLSSHLSLMSLSSSSSYDDVSGSDEEQKVRTVQDLVAILSSMYSLLSGEDTASSQGIDRNQFNKLISILQNIAVTIASEESVQQSLGELPYIVEVTDELSDIEN